MKAEYFCPPIYMGESVYSWLSRWIIGMPFPCITQGQNLLLGSRNKQMNAQFPGYLPQLSAQSGLTLSQLINDHTLIPYFKHFCQENDYASLLKDVKSGDTCATFSKMSLTASRIHPKHANNYCPMCVQEDIERYGVTFWHVSHFLPGVTSCVKHGIDLISVDIPRRALSTPPESDLKAEFKASHPKACLLANLSFSLLTKVNSLGDGVKAAETYRTKLVELGFAANVNSIHQRELRESLEGFWEPILDSYEVALIFNLGQGITFPSCLFYQADSHHHPLLHLLMIGMLFGSIEEFKDYGQCSGNQTHEVQTPSLEEERFIQKENQALEALKAGESLRKASSYSGLSVIKVKQLAIQNNIFIDRREQFIFAHERKVIVEQLRQGIPTKVIAQAFGCSIGAVEQLLSQHPDVVELRTYRRYQIKRGKHRARLLAFLKQEPNCTRGNIQNAIRAAYTWLFKRDKAWLYSHLPRRVRYRYWPRK